MHKVFINVARGHERALVSLSLPLSISLPCSPRFPRLSLLASHERESALPLPLSLAACGRQRLINGLQAQTRIPGSFLMDSGNSSNNTRPLRGKDGGRVGRVGEREKGVRAIKSEGAARGGISRELDGGKRVDRRRNGRASGTARAPRARKTSEQFKLPFQVAALFMRTKIIRLRVRRSPTSARK